MSSANGTPGSPPASRSGTGWIWLSAVWAVALVSTFAALFIGEVMGMTPCQLCWYQRILMFPLAAILGMAAVPSSGIPGLRWPFSPRSLIPIRGMAPRGTRDEAAKT
jgi:hypothetical protein